MENKTIKKTSFYENENELSSDSKDVKLEKENKEENKNNSENNENKSIADNNNQNNAIIEELTALISAIENNLSNPDTIKKEEESIKEGVFEFLSKFGIYYRALASFQINFQNFVQKYGEEEANGAAFQLLNLMVDSAVKAEYYFSLLMKNAFLNPSLSTVEIQTRINFMLETLYDIMKNNFGIEDPRKEYVRLYEEILAENL